MPTTIPAVIHDVFDTSDIALTLTDPNQEDEPVVLANEPFYLMTGFNEGDVIGKNCRFMQGEGTQKTSRNTIRGDFASGRNTRVLIRNYRKDGEAFDNFLFIFTLCDQDDSALFRLGSQFEVPEVGRAQAYELYAKSLMTAIHKINRSDEISANSKIDLQTVEATSVQSLIMARLDTLKAA